HTEREERPVVERPRRVVGPDGRLAPEQDRPRVDTSVGPEDGDTGAGLASDQLPRDRAATPVAWQHRRVEADRGVPGELEQRLRDDLRNVGQHGQISFGAGECRPRISRLERWELVYGNVAGDGCRLHGVDFVAAVRWTDHAYQLVTGRFEALQHLLGERRL